MLELLLEFLWCETLSAPSLGRYWKRSIEMPYYCMVVRVGDNSWKNLKIQQMLDNYKTTDAQIFMDWFFSNNRCLSFLNNFALLFILLGWKSIVLQNVVVSFLGILLRPTVLEKNLKAKGCIWEITLFTLKMMLILLQSIFFLAITEKS